jgi:hypothetical protein
MWAMSLFLCALGRPIIGVYHLSAEGAQIAMQLTIFHCICVSVLRPLGFNLPCVFKATGDSRFTMVVSTLSMWIVRVGFSLTDVAAAKQAAENASGFDTAAQNAQTEWENRLSKIELFDVSAEEREKFYSNFYHTLQ